MQFKTIKQAESIAGRLSDPDKMPGFAYSIPAWLCNVGSKLRTVAGSVCFKCYAMRGRYIFSNVKAAMERRFEAIAHPLWVPAMAFLIIKKLAKKPANEHFFRWHDSGDVQSLEHLEKIAEVCKLTPHVAHWLPTREYAIVSEYYAKHGAWPANLNVRLSGLMVDGPTPDALAKRTGCTVSDVSSKGNHSCPAYKQDGKCGDCRACWIKSTFKVTYPKH